MRTNKSLLLLGAILAVMVLSAPAFSQEAVQPLVPGLTLEKVPGGFVVRNVVEGSLPHASGLLPGDFIKAVDFRPADTLSTQEVLDEISVLPESHGSILLSIKRSNRNLLIRLKQPVTFEGQEAFLEADTSLRIHWQACEETWLDIRQKVASRSPIPKETFDMAFNTFMDSRNALASVEVPKVIPEKTRTTLLKARSHLTRAANLSLLAIRALEDDLSKGKTLTEATMIKNFPNDPNWDEDWILKFESLPGGFNSFYRQMLSEHGKGLALLMEAQQLMKEYR
jgi:hypothetical protein